MLGDADVTAANMKQFSAVVLGVRLYNTQDRITAFVPELLDYVKDGGVVVAQYNTTAELKTKDIGPYPLEISRDRVTDETAEVRMLAPDHPVLNLPNKITAKDFEGWVQERGLYFPDKWDPAWTPILSCHDPNEKPMDGGLLVAKIRQRLLRLYRLFLVQRASRRCPGRVSHLCQFGFVRRRMSRRVFRNDGGRRAFLDARLRHRARALSS